MQPKYQYPMKTMNEILPANLLSALDRGDSSTLKIHISSLILETSGAQMWLDSLGTRLIISDFLTKTKINLSILATCEDQPIENRVRDFFNVLDRCLEELDSEPVLYIQELRQKRYERLIQEQDNSLLKLMKDFMYQSVENPMLNPPRLIERAYEVRENIVCQVWPVISTNYESGYKIAQEELATIVVELINNINQDIVNVVRLK